MEQWIWGKIKSDGFQNEFQDGTLEVSPDAGAPFKRLRFTDVRDIIQGTFILDRNQYIYFMSWYKFNIKQGTIPFSYYDCRVNQYRTTRIIGKPTYTTISNMFSLSVTLSFDSETFYEDRYLTVGLDDAFLTVGNDDAKLVVTKKLRL